MYVVIYSPLTCTYTGMTLPSLYSCSVGTSWKEKSSSFLSFVNCVRARGTNVIFLASSRSKHTTFFFTGESLIERCDIWCYFAKYKVVYFIFFHRWKFNRAMWQLMLFWRGPKTGLYTSFFFTGESLIERCDNWCYFGEVQKQGCILHFFSPVKV